nr:hypothetical protein B0A51_14590 [Rachicladosporium sp. CCFEE 5018]
MARKKAAAATAVGTRKSVRGKGKRKQEGEEEEPLGEEDEQPKAKKVKIKKAPAKKPAKQTNEGDDEGDHPDPAPRPQRGGRKPAVKKGKGKQPARPAIGSDNAGEGRAPPVSGPGEDAAEGAAPADPAPLEGAAGADNLDDEARAKLANRRELLEYTRTHPYDAGRWQQVALGSGGDGDAYILFQVGEDGTVSDRVVMKDAYFEPQYWNDWTKWSGPPSLRRVNEDLCMPNEPHMMIGLKKAGSPNTVVIRAWEKDYDRMFMRILMEYCPHGDLWDIMPEEFVTWKNNKNKLLKSAVQAPDIPEAALWKFFLDLTNACLFMAYGTLDGDNGAIDGWRSIVHRDLKPDNVFLSEPQENDWPSYRTARIGDFGMAVYTHLGDPENPQGYFMRSGLGTIGYIPVEHIIRNRDDGGRQYFDQLDPDASNVWGIGALIMRMMTREADPSQPDYARDTLPDDPSEPQFTPISRTRFSETLIDLVEQCVRGRGRDRILLMDLRRRILEHIVRNADCIRLQSAVNGPGEAGRAFHLEFDRVDKYKRHFARPARGR